MVVRELSEQELPLLVPELGPAMFGSSAWLRDFSPDRALASWREFMRLGIGVVFVLEDQGGKLCGMLGAIALPDPHTHDTKATELFWVTLPGHRGHGLKLLAAYEHWAARQGCRFITLCHMADSMPDRLKTVYERRGYRVSEVAYTKEVC